MKKILALLFSLVVASNAFAQTVENDLVGLHMPAEQAAYLAGILPAGSVLGNNTNLKGRNAANSADINILKIDTNDDLNIISDSGDFIKFVLQEDANRLLNFSAATDAAFLLTFGDAGTTATQTFTITSSTPDGDDDSTSSICGGGSTSENRGACADFYGNETTSKGDIILTTGDAAGSAFLVDLEATAGTFAVRDSSNTNILDIVESTGIVTKSKASDLNFAVGLATIGLQEAVAGTACMGTLTANGATPVVTSTTCALTGSRIFLSRTSSETGTVNAWVSAISTGVSFSITSEAADTGTYNWFILHEAP